MGFRETKLGVNGVQRNQTRGPERICHILLLHKAAPMISQTEAKHPRHTRIDSKTASRPASMKRTNNHHWGSKPMTNTRTRRNIPSCAIETPSSQTPNSCCGPTKSCLPSLDQHLCQLLPTHIYIYMYIYVLIYSNSLENEI